MSDKKISDLVELTSLAADDVLPVVDASANATKRVTYDTLATEVRTESEPLSATTVNASGDITSNGETVYHRGNVVGTVSQSGGTPTGAVVERDSNANGEYVKFADGTMICTRVLSDTQVEGISTSIAASNFNYAAFFASSEPAVGFGLHGDSVFNPQGYDTLDTITISARDLTRWNARARSSGLDAQDVKLFAIGRWY